MREGVEFTMYLFIVLWLIFFTLSIVEEDDEKRMKFELRKTKAFFVCAVLGIVSLFLKWEFDFNNVVEVIILTLGVVFSIWEIYRLESIKKY